MSYVEIISRDGEFDIRPMTRESADSCEMQGGETICIEDAVYDAWVAHMKQHRVFNTLWIQLQNDLRRREARNRGETLP